MVFFYFKEMAIINWGKEKGALYPCCSKCAEVAKSQLFIMALAGRNLITHFFVHCWRKALTTRFSNKTLKIKRLSPGVRQPLE